MELLDRYLQAVRRYLPNRRQDDIIAELRANMESQIEDRESELGRALSQGEFEDLLRKMGPPVMVASRYQPQQYLIGPTLFPLYFYVLRIALLWAFIATVLVSAVVLPLVNESTGVVDSLFRIPAILIQVAGWVTLVFAGIEFAATRYPQACLPIEGITKQWHPNSLPELDKEPRARENRSRSRRPSRRSCSAPCFSDGCCLFPGIRSCSWGRAQCSSRRARSCWLRCGQRSSGVW